MDDASPDCWLTAHKNLCSPNNDMHSCTPMIKPSEPVMYEHYNKGKIVNKASVKLDVCEGEFDGQPWTRQNIKQDTPHSCNKACEDRSKVTQYLRESFISPHVLYKQNHHENVDQADFPAMEVVNKREIQGNLIHDTACDGSIKSTGRLSFHLKCLCCIVPSSHD